MYTLSSAATWGIDALAAAWIVAPTARVANGATDNWTCNFFSRRIPVTTLDHNSLGVVDRIGNRVVNGSLSGLLHRNHYRVVDCSLTGFLNWIHDRVVDDLFMGLVYRAHDRVINNLLVCLVHWLTNRVVDNLFMGLIHWLHNGVVDHFFVRLINRTTNVVRNLLCAGFVNWSIDRVVDRLLMGFVYWSVDRIRNFSVLRASLIANTLYFTIFRHCLIFASGALNSFLLIDNLANCLHHSVSCWCASINTGTTAILITNRTTTGCGRNVCRKGGQQRRQDRQSKQLSHDPFSLNNF